MRSDKSRNPKPWERPAEEVTPGDGELPEGAVVLESGAVKGADGRFLPGHHTKYEFTPETSRRALEIRENKYREAFAKGVIEEFRSTGHVRAKDKSAGEEAWAAVGEKLAELLLDADNARNAVEAAKFIGHATGWMLDTKKRGGGEELFGDPLAGLPPGAVLMIANLSDLMDVRMKQTGVVIDVENQGEEERQSEEDDQDQQEVNDD